MKKLSASTVKNGEKGYYQGFEPTEVKTLRGLGKLMLTYSLSSQLYGADNTATSSGHMVPYRKAIDNITGHGQVVFFDIDNKEKLFDYAGNVIEERCSPEPVTLEKIVAKFEELGWGCVITPSRSSKPEWPKFHIGCFTEREVSDHKSFSKQYATLCMILDDLRVDIAMKSSVQNLTPALGHKVLAVVKGNDIPMHELNHEDITDARWAAKNKTAKYDPAVHNLHLENGGESLSADAMIAEAEAAGEGKTVRCGCHNKMSHGKNDSGAICQMNENRSVHYYCAGCNETVWLRDAEKGNTLEGEVVDMGVAEVVKKLDEGKFDHEEHKKQIKALVGLDDVDRLNAYSGKSLLAASLVGHKDYKKAKLAYTPHKKLVSQADLKAAVQTAFLDLDYEGTEWMANKYAVGTSTEQEQGAQLLSEVGGVGIAQARSLIADVVKENMEAVSDDQYFMHGNLYYALVKGRIIEGLNQSSIKLILAQAGFTKRWENMIKVVTEVDRTVSFLLPSEVKVVRDTLHIRINPMEQWDLEGEADPEIVADYIEIMDHKIDDFINLSVGTLVYHEEKKNKILLTGASNKGKTGLIKLLHPTMISSKEFYKVLEKDTGISIDTSKALKSSGILLVDDVAGHIHDEIKQATNKIPLRVMGLGTETHPMDLCFFTSTHGAIVNNAGSEIRNRLLWVSVGNGDRLITNSKVWIKSAGTLYEDNTTLYLQQQFALALENPISKKAFQRLQKKYALPEGNDRDEVIEKAESAVREELKDLFKPTEEEVYLKHPPESSCSTSEVAIHEKGLVFRYKQTLKEIIIDALKDSSKDVYIDRVKECEDMLMRLISDDRTKRININFQGANGKVKGHLVKKEMFL